MRKNALSISLLAAFCAAASIGLAMGPPNLHAPKTQTTSYKTESGDCTIPVDQFDIDVNNVRARLLDAGDMWWDLSVAQYEVPKGPEGSSAAFPKAIFAGAVWVSALDQGHNLHMAAQTYRQGTSDFWTGPLDNTGNVSSTACSIWDRHFPVFSSEIKPLIGAFQTNGSVPSNLITTNLQSWPGKGNAFLASQGFDVSGILAPFYDVNGDGIYNPAQGDYPTIKQGGKYPSAMAIPGSTGYGLPPYEVNNKTDSLTYIGNTSYADEMVFWVMNDRGGVHTATNGVPMGIQIDLEAFAFQSTDEINNMTFYTYNIINKSGAVFNKTYMSQWTDSDLGCPNNDRIGCDVPRSLAIQYNGNLSANTAGYNYTCDEGTPCIQGIIGYGCDLPMLGIDYFEGPTDTITTLDSATHTRVPIHLGMTSFCGFNIAGGATIGDPTTAAQYRNYQTGFWKDGTPITQNGTGYGGTVPVKYLDPGDPSISTQWSECNPQIGGAIAANDRRFVQTSGPFTFMPNASEVITIGVVFVQPPGGVGTNCPSWSIIGAADDKAQALFDAGFKQLAGPSAPILVIRQLDQKVIINIEDNPIGNNVGETYQQVDDLRVAKGYVIGSNLDSLYRFQGYILYQLANSTVTSSDLNDPTKAVPIIEYDIADTVAHLVNWTAFTDAVTTTAAWIPESTAGNYTIPGIGNDLQNKGIHHSLVDSIDLIGGGQMINHLTYYFGVISFATNNFAQFNPVTGLGQSTPFLLGKDFNTYSAIPGNPESENGGTQLNSSWGTSTMVRRIEGQGNGGNYIELTPVTIDSILNSASFLWDTLDYAVGNDPLAFKVVDPLQVREANFELVIHDTVPYNGVSVSSLAYWTLTVLDSLNIPPIHSERTLDQPFEQIIVDSLGNQYGFSITLGTPFPVYINPVDSLPIYGPISGSITFQDPTYPWLSFLVDSGEATVANWIRSGSNQDQCGLGANMDPLCNVFVDAYNIINGHQVLSDPKALFGSFAGGTWAPYCLAANWSMGPGETPPTVPAGGTARPLTVAGPAFKWDAYNSTAQSPVNTLDKLQSVDIVLTSDKTKWSQCVVFETGENPVLGEYQGAPIPAPDGSLTPPRKGMLRNSYQIDAYGNINTANVGLGMFPGYAINVETGQRLDVAFGEASDEADQNGRDMIWNPTSKMYGSLNQGGAVPYTPIFGGKHFLYVFNTTYADAGYDVFTALTDPTNYDDITSNVAATSPYNYIAKGILKPIYSSIMWTCIPYLTPGDSMLSYDKGLIPNEVTIKLRVQKPYAKFATKATTATVNAGEPEDTLPRYTFSTIGLGPRTGVDSIAKTALDLIRIVPNPYLAYSTYELNANDGRVRITNLPNVCTVNIYTLDGMLVRSLGRALNGNDPVTNKPWDISAGYDLSNTNGSVDLDNTLDWDLKNSAAIPVASGIYLFDIIAPGIGHKVLKWFGAVRPTDVSNF